MLSQDSEDEIRSRFAFELAIWLWKDELNPRVRCAFGNVCPTYLRVHWLNSRETSRQRQSWSEWTRPAKAKRGNANNCQRIVSGNCEDQNVILRYYKKIAIYCPQGSCTLRQQLTILHYLALSCTILHYLALSCTILHYLALSCTILHYLALSCAILRYLAVSCAILYYLALSSMDRILQNPVPKIQGSKNLNPNGVYMLI